MNKTRKAEGFPTEAKVSLASLSATYDGNAKNATATTDPSDLAVTITYGDNAAAPTNVGSYAVTGTISSDNYQGSDSGTLKIFKASQTITVDTQAPDSAAYDATFTVAANAGSGLAVAYSSGSPSVCTNSGAKFTMVSGSGACNVQYDQAGNDNFNPASQVVKNVAAAKATAKVSLASLSATYDGNAKNATATTDPSGLAVTFTYGSGAAPTNVGSYAVTGTISNANYQGSDSGTLVIAKATQTITVTQEAPTSAGYNSTFTVAASAPLQVAITSSGACQGSGTGTAVISMTSSTGICTVTYVQSGGSNYNPAIQVTRTTTAQKATPVVTTWPTASAITYGQALLASTLTGSNPSVPGSFTFTTPALKPNAGSAMQSVTFSPTDLTHYYAVSNSVWVPLACGAPGPLTVPASNSTGRIPVTWGSGNVSGATYVLEQSFNGSYTEVYSGPNSGATVTVSANGSYTYRVRATKNGYYDSANTTTTPCSVTLICGAPGPLTVPASNSTGNIPVTWGSGNISGATYVLEQSFTPGTYTQVYSGPNSGATVTVSANGSYTYRVRATKNGYYDSANTTTSNSCAVTLN